VQLTLRRWYFVLIASLWLAIGIAFAQVDYATATLQGIVFDPICEAKMPTPAQMIRMFRAVFFLASRNPT